MGGVKTPGDSTSIWYVQALLVRLHDKGVSVRKTVVNLLKEVLLAQLAHPMYSSICRALLSVAESPQEEASVKDTIREVFYKIWFSPQETLAISSVQKRSEASKRVPLSPLDVTSLQIVDVLGNEGAEARETTWLVAMIREVLHGSLRMDAADLKAEVKARRVLAMKHCECILSSLLELLLRVEEGDEDLLTRHASLIRGSGADKVVDIISTIACFCEAHPPLLLPHIDTLLPYLKVNRSASTSTTPINNTATSITPSSPTTAAPPITSAANGILSDYHRMRLTSLTLPQARLVGRLIQDMISAACAFEGPALRSRYTLQIIYV
jgi:hypothetical protein